MYFLVFKLFGHLYCSFIAIVGQKTSPDTTNIMLHMRTATSLSSTKSETLKRPPSLVFSVFDQLEEQIFLTP